MRPFSYARVDSLPAAAKAIVASTAAGSQEAIESASFLAGGTTLLDLMKLDVMRPRALVDLRSISDQDLRRIEARPDGLRLGALATMADVADHPEIQRDYPVIAQSLGLAASAQLRNMATLGGNLLQRTRCSYFRDVSWAECNKRAPGSGCAALDGMNRQHAVLGVSDHCIALYPGDFAQALIALDATLQIVGPSGEREMPIADLHRLPGDRPDRESTLAPGEIIARIDVPAGPWTRRSLYMKIRDRESYEFALAAAAVALDMDGSRVRAARIALGGVATAPWRASDAERTLVGDVLDEDAASIAGAAAFASAKVREHNAYKTTLGRRTLERALLAAAAMEV